MIYGAHVTYEPEYDENGRTLPDSRAGGTFRDLALVVEDCASMLAPHLADFDTVVATGVSGMSVAFPLAVRLGKRVAILRKPEDESSHSGNAGTWQGWADVPRRRCLWVDDFIGTGDTELRIMDAVRDAEGDHVGTLLYAGRYGGDAPVLDWRL